MWHWYTNTWQETTKDTEVEPDKDTSMVDVTNIVPPVNVDDEEDEITDEVFELRRRVKGKNVEETRISPIPLPTRSPRNLSTLVSSDTEKLQELTVTHPTPSSGRYGYLFAHPEKAHIASQIQNAYANAIPSLVDASVRSYMSGHILHVHPAQMKFEKTQVPQTSCRSSTIRTRDQDDPHDATHPEGKNSTKRQKTLEYEAYVLLGQSPPSGLVDVVGSSPFLLQQLSAMMMILKNGLPDRHTWELGHEHKFITEIVARRANDCIVSITEPDYKNLNKNDIEDMYLLIMNNKVPDYANTGLLWSLSVFIRSSVIWERVHDFQLGIESYQQKINLTAPTITFPGIEEYDVFSIVYEPVHGIIYTNSKKEKRVMRPSEIHKFCDATLRRTLEGLKSYYNDVKYGYVQKELTNDEVEFLKLFEEEIEVRLNYRDQMRRWEMYVNGRPLGPRRERPE
ncbi:hypothetical protein Tco_0005832 [Tanacetum coccineum]